MSVMLVCRLVLGLTVLKVPLNPNSINPRPVLNRRNEVLDLGLGLEGHVLGLVTLILVNNTDQCQHQQLHFVAVVINNNNNNNNALML